MNTGIVKAVNNPRGYYNRPVARNSIDDLVRTRYTRKCTYLSKRYGIPFDVCIALGDNEDVYPVFVQLVVNSKFYLTPEAEKYMRVSTTSTAKEDYNLVIAKRRYGLKLFLGEYTYRLIGESHFTEKYVNRLTKYILDSRKKSKR